MIFIGDTHGETVIVPKGTIGVGDHGVGFEGVVGPNFSFIRGNHDSPRACEANPKYLGNFGTKVWDGKLWGWVSGGFSTDFALRTEDVNWWADEELSFAQANECFDLLMKRPLYGMISHEAPSTVVGSLVKYTIPTFTSQFLNEVWRKTKPKVWVFGHYHLSSDQKIKGTRFKGLACYEMWDTSWKY